MDRPRPSLSVCRRRVLIQDRRGSGCVLSQCVFIDGFFLPMVMGNNCGSFQSFLAVGLLQIWASGALDAGDNQRRSSPMRMVRTEARDLLVFFLFFSMGFSACLLGQLSTPIYLFICIFARFPYPLIQIHFIKKKIHSAFSDGHLCGWLL